MVWKSTCRNSPHDRPCPLTLCPPHVPLGAAVAAPPLVMLRPTTGQGVVATTPVAALPTAPLISRVATTVLARHRPRPSPIPRPQRRMAPTIRTRRRQLAHRRHAQRPVQRQRRRRRRSRQPVRAPQRTAVPAVLQRRPPMKICLPVGRCAQTATDDLTTLITTRVRPIGSDRNLYHRAGSVVSISAAVCTMLITTQGRQRGSGPTQA